jgi:hypothetical protein
MQTKSLLLQLLADASQRNIQLGKIQLTKLFYLVEVEYYRETGKRLTEVGWFFQSFGPFAYELEHVLEGKDFEKAEQPTAEGSKIMRYTIAKTAKKGESDADPLVQILTRRLIGQWGTCHLKDLVDHVSFQTEPMRQTAMRGEKLDFKTILLDNPMAQFPSKR